MDPGLYFFSKRYFSESSIILRHQAINAYLFVLNFFIKHEFMCKKALAEI